MVEQTLTEKLPISSFLARSWFYEEKCVSGGFSMFPCVYFILIFLDITYLSKLAQIRLIYCTNNKLMHDNVYNKYGIKIR